MTETLQEYCDSRGVRVHLDATAGVVRGVKILGLKSRNGREYLVEALAAAARLYENAKVNVNHPQGNPAGPRDYRDRIGVIRNVAVHPGEGLFADLHFNPKHTLAEQLAWDAEHAPENVGFSHNVLARTSRRGEKEVVEAITRVQSVDLVADPATTRGLFESDQGGGDNRAASADQATTKLTVEQLKRDHGELVEAICQEQAAEANRLRTEVERLEALVASHERRQTIRQLLGEFGLPDPESTGGDAQTVISRRFLESLLAAEDEQAVRELIEERATLVRSLGGDRRPARRESKPLSRDQHTVDRLAPADAKGFVEAIT